MYEIRTDLALEAREKYEEDNVEIKGVRLEKEKKCDDIQITSMVIETENGARSMGRPRGNYITIEAASMDDEDEDYHRIISEQLAHIIRRLAPKGKQLSALVVGLGNREVTSDSLGPKVGGHHAVKTLLPVDDADAVDHALLLEFGQVAVHGAQAQVRIGGLQGLVDPVGAGVDVSRADRLQNRLSLFTIACGLFHVPFLS